MKKKKSNIDVYATAKVKLQVPMTIQVDNAGDEWLTSEQIDFLEFAHIWARYECHNQLKASKKLVQYEQTPVLSTNAVESSDLDNSFFTSTPALSGVH